MLADHRQQPFRNGVHPTRTAISLTRSGAANRLASNPPALSASRKRVGWCGLRGHACPPIPARVRVKRPHATQREPPPSDALRCTATWSAQRASRSGRLVPERGRLPALGSTCPAPAEAVASGIHGEGSPPPGWLIGAGAPALPMAHCFHRVCAARAAAMACSGCVACVSPM